MTQQGPRLSLSVFGPGGAPSIGLPCCGIAQVLSNPSAGVCVTLLRPQLEWLEWRRFSTTSSDVPPGPSSTVSGATRPSCCVRILHPISATPIYCPSPFPATPLHCPSPFPAMPPVTIGHETVMAKASFFGQSGDPPPGTGSFRATQ